MKIFVIIVLIAIVGLFALIIIRVQPKPDKYIQPPIVNDHKIGDLSKTLTHWSLVKIDYNKSTIYYHYKQHDHQTGTKTDSLRRIITGYDANHVWTILDDKKYIK